MSVVLRLGSIAKFTWAFMRVKWTVAGGYVRFMKVLPMALRCLAGSALGLGKDSVWETMPGRRTDEAMASQMDQGGFFLYRSP